MKKKNKSTNGKTGIYYFYAGVLILVLAISLFLFYKATNKGFVKIDGVGENIQMFIDEQDEGTISIDKEGEIIGLSDGQHSIILSKEGFWPWIKEVDIAKKQITEIRPFFVPKNSSGVIIPKEDPEYESIILLFETQKTHIDWEMNEFTPEIILNFNEEIKASDFYKNREDVIIIAIQNGIYALEINSESVPNFQPIYKGKDPTFRKASDNSIYIKDGELLMEVVY